VRPERAGLAVRSLLWALVLPGMMAGLIPWWLGLNRARIDWDDPADLAGVLLIGVGVVLLGLCIRDFAVRGRGTLAPVDPPRELVIAGLYRYVRNPMYLSVATILTGEFLLTRASGLLWYALAWFAMVNLFVIGYEEPALRRQFGAAYADYVARVGRWLPRLPRMEVR
jgi:protein-S-isoprenylcysteine O-methyltransferase Ste14